MKKDLQVKKAMPSLVQVGDGDMVPFFKSVETGLGSNSGRLSADVRTNRLQETLSKGGDPWTTMDLNKHPAVRKAEDDLEAGTRKYQREDYDPDAEDEDNGTEIEGEKEINKSEVGEALNRITKAGECEDPKPKIHKKQFDKIRQLHENMEAIRRSIGDEDLSKAIGGFTTLLLKAYGEEYLKDTHGEHMHPAASAADREVIAYLTKIERIDIDVSPTHNPPVPVAYYSHKSLPPERDDRLVLKALD